MKLPEIGDTVSTAQALALCDHFGLDYLVRRIDSRPELYKEWPFDGCSGLPDQLLGLFTGCDWKEITYRCCLPHDLGYAYGAKGDEEERKRVDERFYTDLITKAGMAKFCADVFREAVRIGGVEQLGLSFSWGFARK